MLYLLQSPFYKITQKLRWEGPCPFPFFSLHIITEIYIDNIKYTHETNNPNNPTLSPEFHSFPFLFLPFHSFPFLFLPFPSFSSFSFLFLPFPCLLPSFSPCQASPLIKLSFDITNIPFHLQRYLQLFLNKSIQLKIKQKHTYLHIFDIFSCTGSQMIQVFKKGTRAFLPSFSTAYLLKNGRVVNSEHSELADVLIQNGIITAVGSNLSHNNAEVVDCSHQLIIPGGIDTHTHMQLPFMGTNAIDDFDSGSKAAIAGGTTSYIDFAIPNKGQSLTSAYQRWRGWADGKTNCDYTLHSAITEWNKDTKDEMKRMVEKGITSFKFFMAYNNVLRIDDIGMYQAFETARDLGALCIVHAENGDLIQQNTRKLLELGVTGPEGHYFSRKESVQAEAVHRVITIAESANVPVYIVHLMSKDSSEEVMRARNKGLLVYGETLASTVGTDGTKLWDKDWDVAARYVMSPCLSPDPTTKTHIMKFIQSGIIDVVGTDNCTFCTEQKRMGKAQFNKIPNGVNGLEDRLAVMWTKGVKAGLLSENQFVDAVSTKAAKIFNMYPRKGAVRAGADADLVIWDPNYKHTISCKTHHQKVDHNIFEGMEVEGKALTTFSRGKAVWRDGKFHNQHQGKYIKRKPFGYVYSRHQNWTNANNPLKFKVDRSQNTSKPVEQKDAKSAEIDRLRDELKKIREERDQLLEEKGVKNKDVAEFYDKNGQFTDSYEALKTFLPSKVFEDVRQIFYGIKADEISLKQQTKQMAASKNIEVKHFKINSIKEQLREPRVVKIAGIQNQIVSPTTEPIKVQKHAIMNRIKQLIEVAASEGANVIGLQEIWTAPFFMCTRERYPWVEFSEPVDGESTQFLCKLAKKHNIVIVSSILERQPNKGTLHNTAVIIDNHGVILGTQVKGHIPRVGDFNESTYYMEGQSGHPVFQTEFGKIGVNICYGRHHPLHWMGFGLNGAEIVFNPSATVNGLSEPLWGIEARNAAIANHYFTVGINRVGTETYPNEFTSGDGKKSKNTFGHFYGSTYITAPDGSRTPSLSRTKDGVLITEVDLNLCQQIKDKWCFTMTGRHKLYADLLTEFSKPNFTPQRVSKEKNNK